MLKNLLTALCLGFVVPGVMFKLANSAAANPVATDIYPQVQAPTVIAPDRPSTANLRSTDKSLIAPANSSLKKVTAGSQLLGRQPQIPDNTQVPSTKLPSISGATDLLTQTKPVSELSDVKPTDWAFQALKSLADRYGCISGYPDGTFRGDRPVTRYELAATLNACLVRVGDRFSSKEDLDTAKSLREEFKAELTTLKERVGGLETQTTNLKEKVTGLEAQNAALKSQQFSANTKLRGLVVLAGQYGNQVGSGVDSRPTVISRTRLYLDTSFNEQNSFTLGFENGNGANDFFSDIKLATNNPEPYGNAGDRANSIINLGGIVYAGSAPELKLLLLSYNFKPTKDLSIIVGSTLRPSDYIDNNTYSSDETSDFSTSFLIKNRLILAAAIDGPGAAGAVFDWNIDGSPFKLRGLYMAGAATSSIGTASNGGLFGDPYQASLELEYGTKLGNNDKDKAALRLQYTKSSTFSLDQNVLGLNGEATFGQIGVFGRYGISMNPQFAKANLFANNNNIQTWMAGVGVNDLLTPGSLLAFAVGQPFVAPGAPATQTNFEAFYRLPITENIKITPAFMFITNPANTTANTAFQGLVRMTYNF